MNWSLIIKINVLMLAFLGVLFVMRSMQTGTGAGGLATLMGAPPPPPPPTPVTSGLTTVDWCDTRVVALERPGKPTIRQEKLKWYANGQVLEFIPVEKWFGRNCRLVIDPIPAGEFNPAEAKPVMVVRFIKGEPETLLGAGGIFQWRQQAFRSAELDQALIDLDSLPRQQGIDKK